MLVTQRLKAEQSALDSSDSRNTAEGAVAMDQEKRIHVEAAPPDKRPWKAIPIIGAVVLVVAVLIRISVWEILYLLGFSIGFPTFLFLLIQKPKNQWQTLEIDDKAIQATTFGGNVRRIGWDEVSLVRVFLHPDDSEMSIFMVESSEKVIVVNYSRFPEDFGKVTAIVEAYCKDKGIKLKHTGATAL